MLLSLRSENKNAMAIVRMRYALLLDREQSADEETIGAGHQVAVETHTSVTVIMADPCVCSQQPSS